MMAENAQNSKHTAAYAECLVKLKLAINRIRLISREFDSD